MLRPVPAAVPPVPMDGPRQPGHVPQLPGHQRRGSGGAVLGFPPRLSFRVVLAHCASRCHLGIHFLGLPCDLTLQMY